MMETVITLGKSSLQQSAVGAARDLSDLRAVGVVHDVDDSKDKLGGRCSGQCKCRDRPGIPQHLNAFLFSNLLSFLTVT